MTSCMSSMRSNQLSYASVTDGWYYTTLCTEMQALFQIFFGKNFFDPKIAEKSLSLIPPLYSGDFPNIVNLK